MSRSAPRQLRKSHKLEENIKRSFAFLPKKVVLYQSIREYEWKNTHCAYYTVLV